MMGAPVIYLGAYRHYLGWVDHRVTKIIVLLDVFEIDRVGHTGALVKITGVGSEVGVVL